MQRGLRRLKPGAKKKNILLLSAGLWSAIGVLLLSKGFYRLFQLTDYQVLVGGTAIFIGSMKSLLVLDRSARSGIKRILELKDGTCLGAVYSIKTWLLVLCMMGMGIILRKSSLPLNLLCFIYITIGWALIFSSRLAWITWFKDKSSLNNRYD
jgi:hypothetical protein